MTKTIHFKVTDDLYYKLVSLKAQTHTDSWEELMKHTVQTSNPKNSIVPKQPERPNSPQTMSSLVLVTTPKEQCTNCGHPYKSHDANGCLEEGGLCDCKQFTEAPQS